MVLRVVFWNKQEHKRLQAGSRAFCCQNSSQSRVPSSLFFSFLSTLVTALRKSSLWNPRRGPRFFPGNVLSTRPFSITKKNWRRTRNEIVSTQIYMRLWHKCGKIDKFLTKAAGSVCRSVRKFCGEQTLRSLCETDKNVLTLLFEVTISAKT